MTVDHLTRGPDSRFGVATSRGTGCGMSIERVALWSAVAVGVTRAATGLWFVTAPRRPSTTWVGRDDAQTRTLVRGIGGRDLAIGAGALAAAARGSSVVPWIAGSVAADLTDAAAGARSLSGEHRTKTLAYAGGFAAIGAGALAAAIAARA